MNREKVVLSETSVVIVLWLYVCVCVCVVTARRW